MPTRAQVAALLDEGHSYETAARALDIPAGLAFMIATGVAADGSDTSARQEDADGPPLAASSQHLVNPPPFNPTRDGAVIAWVRERATRELRRP